MKVPTVKTQSLEGLEVGSDFRRNLYEWPDQRTILQEIRNGFRDWVYYAVGLGMLTVVTFLLLWPIANLFGVRPPALVPIGVVIAGLTAASVGLVGFVLWILLEGLSQCWRAFERLWTAVFS
jgi:hypothetical protein